MAYSITIEGADELVAKLTRVAQMNRVRAVIAQQGAMLVRYLRKYPSKVYSPNPLIKTDDRVRRGFFYRLNHGMISVPYKRTRKLANSWAVSQGLDGFSVTVSNNMSYADLVQGQDAQVTRHKWSGWVTEKGALDLKKPEIIANITNALNKEVEGV
jgi:transcriptional regulator with PAS, ATPase and Fis domain